MAAVNGASRGARSARLYSLHPQQDPWRASSLAWRTGGDDDEQVYGRNKVIRLVPRQVINSGFRRKWSTTFTC
jgi:hypothetical protein